MSGRFRSGAFLPDEITSSKDLAVSRTTYREAIRVLAAKGLVESKPKVGTKVTPKNKWHVLDPDLMFWLLEAGQDKKTADHLFELRNIVEPAAAALAATRRTEEHLKAMRQALETMRRYARGTAANCQADTDFHSTILLAANNPYLFSLLNGLIAALYATKPYRKLGNSHYNRISQRDHVLNAIANRDPATAYSAMRALIQQTSIEILRSGSCRA